MIDTRRGSRLLKEYLLKVCSFHLERLISSVFIITMPDEMRLDYGESRVVLFSKCWECLQWFMVAGGSTKAAVIASLTQLQAN